MTLRWYKQFIKFGLVGVTNTAIDFAVYWFLTRQFIFWSQHKVLASIVAVSIAIMNSYMWNSRWTFRAITRSRSTLTTAARFIVVTSLGFVLQTSLFWLLLQVELPDLLAKLCTIGAVLVWNFTANRYWTFAHPKN
jgi:putative flippase GtrA